MKKTSAAMVRQIGEFEGLRLRPYKCAAGVWTVGYGHTGKDVTQKGVEVSAGVYVDEITEAQAEALLARDLEGAERAVMALEKEAGIDLFPCEFDALVSWVYNCGSGNFRSSTLRKVVADKGKPVEVAAQMMRWNKAAGKVLPGLTRRRAIESAWYACGEALVEAVGADVVRVVTEWIEKNGCKV